MGKVEFTAPVGHKRTGSGRLIAKSVLLIYDPESEEWQYLSARRVDWERISNTKAFGMGEFAVEPGSIIKHIYKERGETDVKVYYADPSAGLVEVPFREEFRPVEEIEGIKLYKKYTIITLPDGRELELPENAYKVNEISNRILNKDEAIKLIKDYKEAMKQPLRYIVRMVREVVLHRLPENLAPKRILMEAFDDLEIFVKTPWTPATREVVDRLKKISKYVKVSSHNIWIPAYVLMKNYDEIMEVLRSSMEGYEDLVRDERIRRPLRDTIVGAVEKIIAEYMELKPGEIEFIRYMGRSFEVKTVFLGKDRFKKIVSKKGVGYDFGSFYVDLDNKSEVAKKILSEVERLYREKVYPVIKEALESLEDRG